MLVVANGADAMVRSGKRTKSIFLRKNQPSAIMQDVPPFLFMTIHKTKS